MKTHVIVGAGTSGIVLARCLAEQGDSVVLIEHGLQPPRGGPRSAAEQALNLQSCDDIWTYQAFDKRYADAFVTEGCSDLAGRQLVYPAGRGVGGSSNINAMIHCKGHEEVFSRFWPKTWNKHFICAMEERVNKLTAYGTVETSGTMAEIIKGAGPCSGSIQTCYTTSMSASRSARSSLADLLECAPSGITTHCGLSAVRIVVEHGTAVGVIAKDGQNVEHLFCPQGGGEIIIAAGALATPALLTKSNLFEGDEHIVFDAFQDHSILPFMLLGNWWSGWIPQRAGRPLHPISSVHGWVYLDADGSVWDATASNPLPSCQLLFLDGFCAPGLVEMLLPRFARSSLFYNSFLRPALAVILNAVASISLMRWLCGFVFGALVCRVQPSGKGKLTVRRTDGSSTIDRAPLTEEDRQAMWCALLAAKAFVAKAKQSSGLWCFELLPGPWFSYALSRRSFDHYLALFCSTYFHPCGTCAMLTDELIAQGKRCVVDDHLRVFGVNGLRVADASVIPHIPTAPIAATCMIIGAAAAHFIQADCVTS